MKLATAHLKNVDNSPYSQNKMIQTPKESREIPEDYEKRTWRDRMHVNPNGQLFIPAMQFANSLKEAAKYLSIQIPGRGKSTYTKHFEAGVMVADNLVLPVKAADVEGEWISVPSDGVRGSGKRVAKCFPRIDEWEGSVPYWILDDIITEDVVMQVLKVSGSLIGIGRFRPRNLGFYGRFVVKELSWQDNIQL